MHHHLPHLPLALAATGLLALAAGCASRDEPPRAPHADAFAAEARPENDWTPQSPQDKWWERGDTACPPGAKMVGDVPPKGFVLECRTPDGKRNGRSSIWFESGHAGTYAEYENDVPHGRWLYWHHNQKLVEGYFDHGRRQGDWKYYFGAGSGFDMRARWDERNARSYVVESYDRGLLIKSVPYKDGAPIE